MVTGAIPDAREPREMQLILNDVAHALTNLVTIYTADPGSGVPRALNAFDLLGGRFERGAHVFRARKGGEFAGLTVQRHDMESAISILRSAHIAFRTPRTG